MGLSDILALITGVLQFPKEILALIGVFKSTPQENHQKLIESIQAQAKTFEETGRPTWGA